MIIYVYYYKGKRHTDTTTAYLKNLGMDEDGIKALQDSAAWNSAQTKH